MKKTIYLLSLAIGLLSPLHAQIFVNKSAIGNNDGTSWENAYTDLQNALLNAQNGNQIWVAEGTYKPTDGTDRKISFVMKKGVSIYGGFKGDEKELYERDWLNHLTILSGDIGTPNDMSDNSYNVLENKNNNLNSSAMLDGFIITAGNANDPEPYERGGGMFNKGSSPKIVNCHFFQNGGQYGAGIYNLANSNPQIINCRFTENTTTGGGGGIYNFLFSSPEIVNCEISGNEALSQFGGGIYNFQSSPVLINCLISGNKALRGGGIYNTNHSEPHLINCTLSGNFAQEDGGGLFNFGSESFLSNTIVWNNKVEHGILLQSESNYNLADGAINMKFSLVQHFFESELPGNLNGIGSENDPLFYEPIAPDEAPTTNGNFQLTTQSPLIDKGNNKINTSYTDLEGNSRIIGGIIDLGAFEYEELVGLQAFELHRAQIDVFPNPSNGILHIKTPENLEMEALSIWDEQGISIKQEVIIGKDNVLIINAEELNSGYYFLQLKTNKGVFNQKVFFTH